jgi:hypothetical protein
MDCVSAGDSIRFDIFVVPSKEAPRQLTHDNTMMSGFAWLPDSTAIVYSSSRGQTMPYLATSALWRSRWPTERAPDHLGRNVYMHPDIARSGAIVATRCESRPISGSFRWAVLQATTRERRARDPADRAS